MNTNRTQKMRIPSRAAEQGYLLLSVMLLITLMLVVLAIGAPRIAQQIKRQKEEELVRRGKEYAVAIKKFYHKNGTYPLSLDQLESTNNQRFLRRRFKDPMTETGEWKLIHVGEAQITLSNQAGPGGPQGPGQTGSLTTNFPGSQLPGAQPGSSPGLNTGSPTSSSGFNPGGLNSGGLNSGGLNSGGLNSGGLNSGGFNPGGLSGSTPAGAGGQLGGGQMGTLNTQNIGTGLGPNAQGGGPIIGVASTSKNKSIKQFNGSSEYDQWLFVYDPRLEQGPGGGGVTVASPRSGSPTSGTVPAGVAQPVPAGVVSPAAPPNQPTGSPTPTPQPMPTTTPQPTPQ